jgi:hypothetical protein
MKSLQKWVRHFERNKENRQEPDWDASLEMTGRPLGLLRKSIQQFQLGDGGGPAYLIAWNRQRYLADPGVKRLVDLWFKEEREHSRLLGDMLRRLDGQEIQGHWSFSLFCTVRKLLGFRFELYALLCTEIVSHVYYKMLRKHGRDIALQQMCGLIIRDETGHIAFHRSRLAEEAAGQGNHRRYGKAWECFFRLRAVAAGTVLWVNHRGALRAMGATDAEFYRWIWRDVSAFVRGLRRDCEVALTGGAKMLTAVAPSPQHTA